jgi:hypothetical protein
LTDVEFTGPDDGVAVGGLESKIGGGQVIETTDDGGLRWTVTHYVPNCESVKCQSSTVDGLAAVDLQSADSGFVFDGVCVDSLPGPCGDQLMWTSDGGRTLTRLAAPPGDGWLSVAVTGPGHFVGAAFGRTGEKGFSAIGLTTDFGRRWRYEAPPAHFHSDWGDPLTGAGRHLLWVTPVGLLASRDGGHHWTPVTSRRAARRRLRAYRRHLGTRDTTFRTSDGNAEWQVYTQGLSIRTWVLYRPEAGIAWRAHRMPRWFGNWVESVIATGPHTAVFAGTDADLWRTTDGGATWYETWPRLPGEDREAGAGRSR